MRTAGASAEARRRATCGGSQVAEALWLAGGSVERGALSGWPAAFLACPSASRSAQWSQRERDPVLASGSTLVASLWRRGVEP